MPRVLVVSNAPTPYNDALFVQVGRQPGIELRVVYGASTEAHRAWDLESDKGYSYEVLSGWTFGGSNHLNPGVVGTVRDFAPDIAVLTGSYTMPTAQIVAVALRAARTPWLYWGEELTHGAAPSAAGAARALLRRPIRRARGVLAIGSRARASYAHAGVAPDAIADFRYYADTERFALTAAARATARARLRASLRLPDDTCVLLYCGQLIARKNVGTLIRALARIHDVAEASDVRAAVLVAGDGPERAALEHLAIACGVRHAVQFLGFRQPSELPTVFAAADAFVLPSRAEGWGVVVTEAMAAGLPVIASERVNAAADLVRGGKNGACFAPDDVEALARLSTELARDRAYRDALGACARATVRNETPRVAAPRLVRLLAAASARLPIAEL